MRAMCFLVLALSAAPAAAQQTPWRTDYAAARREAKETNRPLVIDVGTENCCWCQKLDATTFRDPDVVRLLSERFVAVKVQAAQQRELVDTLRIQSFPTLVFAAPDGKILGLHEGYVEAPKFQQQLHKTLASVTKTAPAESVRQTAPPMPPVAGRPLRNLVAEQAGQRRDPERLTEICQELAECQAELQLELAEALLQSGQTDRAAQCFQKAALHAPGSRFAQTAQARLQSLAAASPSKPAVVRGQSPGP